MSTPDPAPSRLEKRQSPFPDAGEARLFLEKNNYTQRRLIDGAALLPFFGMLLFLVPIVWPKEDAGERVFTSSAALYIFIVWLVLILMGAYLTWRIKPVDDGDTAEKTAPVDESEEQGPTEWAR